jgi:hypothetical protein
MTLCQQTVLLESLVRWVLGGYSCWQAFELAEGLQEKAALKMEGIKPSG